ncbi:MAG: hypothetical protein ACTSPB_00150 [Candidatus Thorarchaeota archaeon]
MTLYTVDFKCLSACLGEVKDIKGFKVEANTEVQAKNQIKEWFDVQGKIFIAKAVPLEIMNELPTREEAGVFEHMTYSFLRKDGVVYRASSSLNAMTVSMEAVQSRKDYGDSWNHKFVMVKNNDWIEFFTQAPPCTLFGLPEYKYCDECPDGCTKMGIPLYGKEINGDGTPHKKAVV